MFDFAGRSMAMRLPRSQGLSRRHVARGPPKTTDRCSISQTLVGQPNEAGQPGKPYQRNP